MKRYLIILALCGAAYGDDFRLARQIAIEIEAEHQRVEALDAYWEGRGYYRVGQYYYRGHRESVGRTTKSPADLAKESVQSWR